MSLRVAKFQGVRCVLLGSLLALGCGSTSDELGVAQEPLTTGPFYLQAVHSGKCLGVQGGSTANGANVAQFNCDQSSSQTFELISAAGGSYKIAAAHSGKCLAVKGGTNKLKNGQTIQQQPCTNNQLRRFKVEELGQDVVKLRNLKSDKCVDIKAAQQNSGANAQQWTCHNNDNQRFQMVPVGPPPAPELVLHYNFEQSVTNDSGPFNLDATVFGTSPQLVPSQSGLGSAASFDAQPECLRVGEDNTLDLATYTIAAWVKPDPGEPTLDPQHLRMEVMEKTDSYWMNVRHDALDSNGLPKVRCGSFLQTPTEPSAWYLADTPSGIPRNQWTHIACTWNGSRFEIYVDGEASGAITKYKNQSVEDPPPGSTVVQNDYPLVLGCKENRPDRIAAGAPRFVAQWEGHLDEVRLYDGALSAEDIAALAE